MTKEWCFCTPDLAFVCIEAESGFASMFHNCFQVGIMVNKVISIINDDVIGDASYAREVTEGLIDLLLENVLGADQTKGEMQESVTTTG